jgi:hypothetical protein
VRVVSADARLLRLHIGDFYPLVYHQHPGATAIVQRLGRIMVRAQLPACSPVASVGGCGCFVSRK